MNWIRDLGQESCNKCALDLASFLGQPKARSCPRGQVWPAEGSPRVCGGRAAPLGGHHEGLAGLLCLKSR